MTSKKPGPKFQVHYAIAILQTKPGERYAASDLANLIYDKSDWRQVDEWESFRQVFYNWVRRRSKDFPGMKPKGPKTHEELMCLLTRSAVMKAEKQRPELAEAAALWRRYYQSEEDAVLDAEAAVSESESPKSRWAQFSRLALALKPRLAYPRLLALTAVALMMVAFAIYKDPFHILRQHGLTAYTEYVSNMDSDSAQALFNKAYAHYRSAEYKQAKTLARTILVNPPSEKLRADALYLLGGVAQAQGQPDEALNLYQQALAINEAEGLYNSCYVVALALSRLYEEQGDLNEAQFLLEKAKGYFESSPSPENIDFAHYYYKRSRISEELGNLSDALLNMKMARDMFESSDNEDRFADSESHLGLLYLRMGELGLGNLHSRKASRLITNLNDKRFEMYNQVNFVLLGMLLGQPDLELEEEIRSWAQSKGDRQLESHLDRVLRSGSLE